MTFWRKNWFDYFHDHTVSMLFRLFFCSIQLIITDLMYIQWLYLCVCVCCYYLPNKSTTSVTDVTLYVHQFNIFIHLHTVDDSTQKKCSHFTSSDNQHKYTQIHKKPPWMQSGRYINQIPQEICQQIILLFYCCSRISYNSILQHIWLTVIFIFDVDKA